MTILFRVACLLVVISACAAPPRIPPAGGVPQYPPRPANCALLVFHTPEPAVVAWDDLGVAQVTCHLDTAQPECMQRFRAEACRMGADLLYDVPKKPIRPKELAIGFRGRAAHSRAPLPTPNNASPPTPRAVAPPTPPPSATISYAPRDGGVPVDAAIESTSAADGRASQ